MTAQDQPGPRTRLDLRRLILALTIFSAVLPFANTFYASYLVQRQQLIDNTLDSNYAYATKLAQSIDDFLQSTLQQLAFSADLLAEHMDDDARLSAEANRLRLQTDSFNSVTVLDNTGHVLAASPETLPLKGRTLTSPGVQQTLAEKAPLISQPYLSTTGNLLIFISHPIFTEDGSYLGAVGGSIYLKQQSILHQLLGSHFYRDSSYLYAVDRNKHIIYHPDPNRVGETITGNTAINTLADGQGGKGPTVNSRGVEMLSGYAVVPATGWGIVAQRSKEATLAPLNELMQTMLYKALPLALLTLAGIWWSVRWIANPLRQLADGAHAMDQPGTTQHIQSVKSWYFEAQELKKALLMGMGLLHQNISKLREDLNTDLLTGLGNRRCLTEAMAELEQAHTPFAVIAIDIDRFKSINDSFGHATGDEVLKSLGQQMRAISRADDIPCRAGGEEFLLLLPKTSLRDAAQVAERLRALVANAERPVVGRITISLGVAHWPDSGADMKTVFQQADAMLYAAKRGGRNRVEVQPLNPASRPQP